VMADEGDNLISGTTRVTTQSPRKCQDMSANTSVRCFDDERTTLTVGTTDSQDDEQDPALRDSNPSSPCWCVAGFWKEITVGCRAHFMDVDKRDGRHDWVIM